MSSNKAGSTLGTLGNYELLEEIGRGNFGTVYRACHWQSRQIAAVKVIPAMLAKHPTLLKRFQQECVMAAKIDHPNIVRVLEYSVNPETPFLVMECVEGLSLGDRLERDRKIDEEEAIRLIVQTAQGLDQIHQAGLLHRDVKPDNILVDTAGIVKITDLGLAKDVEADIELTRTGTGLGTPNFMAPEQFRNAKNVDRRCDIYALGATLYQMVTGVLPFADAKPMNVLMRKLKNQLVAPEKIAPWLGDRTVQAIQRAVTIEPKERFSSCWEFVGSLVDTGAGLGEEFTRLMASLDYWYVVYEERGKFRRASGNSAVLGLALREGRLGNFDTLKLSRSMAGPFKPLERFPELLDVLNDKGPPARPRKVSPISDMRGSPDAAERTTAPGRQGQETCAAQESPPIRPETEIHLKPSDSPPVPAENPAKPFSETCSLVHQETQELNQLRSIRSGTIFLNNEAAFGGKAASDAIPIRAEQLPSVPIKIGTQPQVARNLSNLDSAQEPLDWWKTVLFLALTGVGTFLAGHYLLGIFQ